MTLADKVTSIRLVLAPAFFLVFLLPGFLPSLGAVWTVPVLWIIFFVSEITDLLDGKIARKRGEVSDFGKLFDPFADTLTQITFFLCFVIDGILPAFLFLLVLYREFSILFIRNLMLRKGVALGARMSGKIKTVAYIIAGALALLAASLNRLAYNNEFYHWAVLAAISVFAFSVLAAIFSFFQYARVYIKTSKNNENS